MASVVPALLVMLECTVAKMWTSVLLLHVQMQPTAL